MLSSLPALLVLKFLVTTLAFLLAMRLALRAFADLPHPPAPTTLAAILLGTVLGAKLGFAAGYPALLRFDSFDGFWILVAGSSVPGALLGGWLALAWSPSEPGRGEFRGRLADVLAVPVLLALLILDLGSLNWALSEPGFGAPAPHWGLDFGDGVRRHPVALYEALALAGLLGVARAMGRARLAPGLGAAMLAASCAGIGFLLGFLKPPYGPALLAERVHPPVALYPGTGLSWAWTAEQWLYLILILVLAAACARGARPRGEVLG